MPSTAFPLPHVNQPWIDPETGLPTQVFYQFMAATFPTGVNVLANVMQLTPILFRQLPVDPIEGMFAAVTDSTTNTQNAKISGGGRSHVLAYYDGTAWTVK